MLKHINLQLFAEDTIPDKKEDANLDNKPELSPIRNAFGLSAKKEDVKKEDKKPDVKPDVKPEVKPEDKKEPETKEPEVKKDEEYITLKHLGKEVKVPVSERDKYMQMGYDYPHVKDELTKSKSTLQRIAAIEGFKSVDEYLAELDKKEKAKLAEKIEEAAGDPDKIDEIIENHPKVIETREKDRQIAYKEVKAELAKDRFFKELEPRFDELMAQNPTASPDLVYKIIRSDYLTPEKLNELTTTVKESTEKKVLADIHDKERRGAPTGGDADEGKDIVQVTSFGSKLAGVFGLNKSEAQKAAQRTHEKLKKG